MSTPTQIEYAVWRSEAASDDYHVLWHCHDLPSTLPYHPLALQSKLRDSIQSTQLYACGIELVSSSRHGNWRELCHCGQCRHRQDCQKKISVWQNGLHAMHM